jgi:hypothetical protein
MNFKLIKENDYYVNPTRTGYGTLPPFLLGILERKQVKPFDGIRPDWLPNTKRMREYLIDRYWGGDYQSRSRRWVMAHDGTPLSVDSVQIDHITKWEDISKQLLLMYSGERASGTPFGHLTRLPQEDGVLIKGVDYIDDPEILYQWGEDVLYKFTNIGALKYFHTIENLRPLSGSTNSQRNNKKYKDSDLSIAELGSIDPKLSNKLSQLSASVEEFSKQAYHEVASHSETEDSDLYAEKYIQLADQIISVISQINRSEFL